MTYSEILCLIQQGYVLQNNGIMLKLPADFKVLDYFLEFRPRFSVSRQTPKVAKIKTKEVIK